jgi:hypothetical protein
LLSNWSELLLVVPRNGKASRIINITIVIEKAQVFTQNEQAKNAIINTLLVVNGLKLDDNCQARQIEA